MIDTPKRERGPARPEPDRTAGGALVARVPDHPMLRPTKRGLGRPLRYAAREFLDNRNAGAAMVAGVARASIFDVPAF